MGEFVEDRIELCNSCEYKTSALGVDVCNKCGCVIYLKARMKNAECPMNKWKAEGL